MEKIIYKIIGIILCSCLFIIPVQAEALTIATLIAHPSDYDGKEITLAGEAIGELLERGDMAWVNINDGTSAMGIYISREQAEQINLWGNYKQRGDQVQITGTFHKTYNEQGGDMAIEGQSLEVIAAGYKVEHPVGIGRIVALIILVPLAGGIGFVNFKKARKEKEI